MQILKSINESSIKTNLALLYISIKKDFITAQDCCVLLNERLSNSDNKHEIDLLVELNLNEDDKDKFLDIFKEYIYNNTSLDIKYYSELSILYYGVILLESICNKKLSIQDKLYKVESVWVDLNYPDDLRNFIYYMPCEKGEECEGGIEVIYNKILNYIEKNSKKLKELIKEAL